MSKEFSSLIENEEFIEAVALKIAKSTRLQMIILEAIIKNVATKDDIRELRQATEADIRELRQATEADIRELRQATEADIRELRHYVDVRINDLDKRIDALDRRIDALDKRISLLQWITILGFMLVSVITAIIQFIAMSLR